jgi:hypothetical protein
MRLGEGLALFLRERHLYGWPELPSWLFAPERWTYSTAFTVSIVVAGTAFAMGSIVTSLAEVPSIQALKK